MRKMLKRAFALVLTVAMTSSVFPATAMAETELLPNAGSRAVSLNPDYEWNFENVAGTTINNTGSVAGGSATLRGTASVGTQQITIGSGTYSSASNHVLTLNGGSTGSSYVDLPSDLYQGVSSSTGFSWTFWMKTASNVGSYTRLISSASSSSNNEFAYAPFASDQVWNVIFDDNNLYRAIYASEPAKAVWNHIAISINADAVTFYVNGAKISSSVTSGSASNLRARLDSMSTLVKNALGRTYSTWGDPDCAAQLDDVAMYKRALTSSEVKTLAESYGLTVAAPKGEQDAQEGVYQNGTKLTLVDSLTTTSVDGKITVKIWKDNNNGYYYSVSKEGKVVIECSSIGMITTRQDLSTNLTLDTGSVKVVEGRETYDLLQGSSSTIDKPYKELSFTLSRGTSKMTVVFRIFEDGIGYRYVVDGDTTSSSESTVVTSEVSEFTLPDKGNMWTIAPSVTYEAYEYTRGKLASLYDYNTSYSTPILASLEEDAGNNWVLLSEANVYNEENPYSASIFKTVSGEKSIQTRFGQYLVQETDESYDQRRYGASYRNIESSTMRNVFHTPWRVAIISSDLEGIANSSLITDLNPEPEGDFSWVVPGGSVWSWWSTSADAIDFNTMKDYIDFAANTGMPYCLVDYGWEIWNNYEARIAELVDYADERGVGLLLWYGVNKFDADHIFDLDSTDEIEKAFAWCERMGVKGVKVDYINSDSQFAMKVMYDLADLAAKHHLVLNYHGATNPRGENRTYPNILSSEAVAGAENFKWSNGSSIASLLTLPYTRNVLGSMEFTPNGTKVNSSQATAGFQLAMAVVYESAVQTYASSAYVYEGYNGLSLIADVPTVWDESLLLDGYPGESVVRARRNGDNWYLGAMTRNAATYQVALDFLDDNTEYTAYIYRDNASGRDIEVRTQKVTSGTVLSLNLMANGGCAVKLTKNDPIKVTVYDNYTYYEAENATLAGAARTAQNAYASNLAVVGYVGSGSANTLTFNNVYAPKAGQYDLRVYIVAGSARNLSVSVNNSQTVNMTNLLGVSGDWSAVRAVSTKINLQAGNNTIRLYNNSDYAPDIDRIAVDNAQVQVADVNGLAVMVAEAGRYKLDRYTEESVKVLQEVLAEANSLLKNVPSKEDQVLVDAMTDRLQKAIESLVKKPIEPVVLADFDFDDETDGFVSENAKASGNHTLTDSYSELSGQALYLDGTSSNFLKVTNKDGSSLLAGAEELTISFEAKADRTEANWIFYAAPNDNTQNYPNEHYIGVFMQDGAVKAERYDNEGSRPAAPSAAVENDWARVDVVLTEEKTLLYVNGELKAEEASDYAVEDILGDSGILYIGKANWVDGEFYKGWIDNMTIRNYALDAETIASNAEAFMNAKNGIIQELPFTDVKEGDWFYEAVYDNYFANLMTGKDATTFAPLENLTRAQFAMILYRMENSPAIAYNAKFPDIPDGDWFTDAVLWAEANGIVTGYIQTGKFEPHQNITREQAALMMLRYANFKGYDAKASVDLGSFADGGSVSDYATEAMRWAVGKGIITGKDNETKLDPQGSTLRAEAAVIIDRFVDAYAK